VKLYGSLTSPFVRAVRIAAIELGLDDAIEFAPTIVRPTEPNRDYGRSVNPLRRVPALATEEGETIIDSRVIIEHLNMRAAGSIIPEGAARIDALNRHAVTTGATEGLVSAMYETKLRPEPLRWPEWRADLIDKAHAALDWSEERARDFERAFDIGAIGLVCLIGYGGLRFPEIDWLRGRRGIGSFYEKALSRRSVADTAPKEA
jgi:glutathione S-transferase